MEHESLKVEASAADDALHILDTLDAFDIREHRLERLLRLLKRRLVVVGTPFAPPLCVWQREDVWSQPDTGGSRPRLRGDGEG